MNKLAFLALAAAPLLVPAAASAQTVVHSGPNVVVRSHGGPFMHPGANFRHRRLERGFFIHPFWFGPQFHVQNWQLYGFPQPPRDHRWVRYYDDAYMIDREGRVRDHRYGLDWDEYGERWEMEDGIPSYYGRGDWRPGEEDYAWFDRHGYGRDRDHDYADRRRHDRHGDDRHDDDDRDYAGHGYGPPAGCHAMPQGPCGGYGYYGYGGYGIAYPIVIETTVVTGGGCGRCYEEVVEEVVEVRRPARRHRRRAPPRHRSPPPPPPPAGERG